MKRPRPHMSVSVQRDAAVLQLGLDPKAVDWDHDPALGIRVFNEATGKYEPDANDPRFITVRARTREADGHKAKTFGTGGTTAGSDLQRIAKIKRFEKAREVLAEAEQRTSRPRSKIASRGFRKSDPQRRASKPLERNIAHD